MNFRNDSIEKYYFQKPSNFGYLKSFILHREFNDNSCSDYTVELLMCPRPGSEEDKQLYLTFYGVKDLKIGNLEGLLSYLIDIRQHKHQIEDINYKVIENEYNAFSFLCADFEVKIK